MLGEVVRIGFFFLGHVSDHLMTVWKQVSESTPMLCRSDVNIHNSIYTIRYWYVYIRAVLFSPRDGRPAVTKYGDRRRRLIRAAWLAAACRPDRMLSSTHSFTSPSVSPTGHCARDISHQSVDAGPEQYSYFSEESRQLQSKMLRQWIDLVICYCSRLSILVYHLHFWQRNMLFELALLSS